MQQLQTKHHNNGVLELILNRPDKKNALTLAMYEGLTSQLAQATDNTDVRVVLLRGEGDSFTAGNDLADFLQGANGTAGMQTILGYLHALVDFPKPLVAAVQGHAVGIGTTMLLHCDHVVVADSLKAQMPFVKLGLLPEGGSSWLLPSQLGHRKAFELLISGAVLDASGACQLGIANQQCTEQALYTTALAHAAKLTELPQQAVIQSKAMLKADWRAKLHSVIDDEGAQFAARLQGEEAREIIAAFMQRS